MSKLIQLNQVKKNVIVSILVQVISISVSFVMNLIVPKYISEYQYAYWQTYMLYVGYTGVLHFGLIDGIVLRYSQYDYEELDQARIRSQFLMLLGLNSLFSLFSILIVSNMEASDLQSVFIYVAIGIIIKNLFTYASYTFQMTNRITNYAILIISQRVFFGVITVLLLIMHVNRFHYFCIADLAGDLFGFLLCFRSNRKLYIGKIIPVREVLAECKINIISGIILLISNWSSMLLVGSVKMIIQWHWNELTFGKVSFSFSLSNLFLTFVTAISVVLFPSLKRMNQEDLPRGYQNIRNVISPLLFFVMLFYFPGCWLLNLWLPKYNASLVYLGILLPIIIYTSKVSLLTNNYLKVYRKEKSMLIVNVVSVIVAFAIFLLLACVFNNLTLLLCSVVMIMMGRSILSELVVMKLIHIKFVKEFIVEAVVTVGFIMTARFFSLIVGFITYFMILVIYFAINRDSIIPYFKKFTLRRKSK